MHSPTQKILASYFNLPCTDSNSTHSEMNTADDIVAAVAAVNAIHFPSVTCIDVSIEPRCACGVLDVLMTQTASCKALASLSMTISGEILSTPLVDKIVQTLSKMKTLSDFGLSVSRDHDRFAAALFVGICRYLPVENLRKFRLNCRLFVVGNTFAKTSFLLVRFLARATNLESLTLEVEDLSQYVCQYIARYGIEKLSHLPIESRQKFLHSRCSLKELVVQRDFGGFVPTRIGIWYDAEDDLTWLDFFGSSKKLETLEFRLGRYFPYKDPSFCTKFAAYIEQMENIDNIDVDLDGKADETVGMAVAGLVKRIVHWKRLLITGITMSQSTVDDLRQHSSSRNAIQSPVYFTCDKYMYGHPSGPPPLYMCTLSSFIPFVASSDT